MTNAVKATQSHDKNFLSQGSNEKMCTGILAKIGAPAVTNQRAGHVLGRGVCARLMGRCLPHELAEEQPPENHNGQHTEGGNHVTVGTPEQQQAMVEFA